MESDQEAEIDGHDLDDNASFASVDDLEGASVPHFVMT
jgi:hypothetical protein